MELHFNLLAMIDYVCKSKFKTLCNGQIQAES